MPDGYKLYVNEERTIMVRVWTGGAPEGAWEGIWDKAEVATREDSHAIWGPPVTVKLVEN